VNAPSIAVEYPNKSYGEILKFLFYFLSTIFFLFSPLSYAEGNDLNKMPWARGGLGIGFFIASLDTDLRFGTGVGIEIDAEKLLGMNDTESVFRLDAFWRFSKNQKHRFNINWFSLNRKGSKSISRDIIIEGPEEQEIIISAGSKVESQLGLDLYQGVYSYSFILDERLDIAVTTGLYVAPIEMQLNAEGIFEGESRESFTAPLPTFGLRTDISITPKWFLRGRTEVFYLKYSNFTGYILSANGAIEYQPWKRIGIGTGFDILHLLIEADGEEYPGVDLKGEIEFQYIGLLIYGKLYF